VRLPRRLVNLYPPFLGAGIRVRARPDLRHVEATLAWRWWSRDHLGTQPGGSIYAMADPFYTVMLGERLGRSYTVSLTEATVRYLKPGRSRLTAEFTLDDDQVQTLRREADAAGMTTAVFRVAVRDRGGEIVAEVVQTLHIRVRRFARRQEGASVGDGRAERSGTGPLEPPLRRPRAPDRVAGLSPSGAPPRSARR
jgi:acyl-coenzyme A thioesterase PaaI-like protein